MQQAYQKDKTGEEEFNAANDGDATGGPGYILVWGKRTEIGTKSTRSASFSKASHMLIMDSYCREIKVRFVAQNAVCRIYFSGQH